MTDKRHRGGLPWVCGLFLVACATPATQNGHSAVSLALGTGADRFEPLAPGGPLLAYKGPQGGFHVYLTLRASGIMPGDPTLATSLCKTENANPCVEFTVTDLATGRTLDAYRALRAAFVAVPDAPGVLELHKSRLVILDIASLREVDGHEFLVTGAVDDREGAHGDAKLTVECQGAPEL